MNKKKEAFPKIEVRDLANQSPDELVVWLSTSWEPILFGRHNRLYELAPFAKYNRQASELADLFTLGFLKQPEIVRENLEKAVLKRLGCLALRVTNNEEANRWWFYLSVANKTEMKSVGVFACQYLSVNFINEFMDALPSNITKNAFGFLINTGPNHSSGAPFIHTLIESRHFPYERAAEALARLFQIHPENSQLHILKVYEPLKRLFEKYDDIDSLQKLKSNLARAFDRFVVTHDIYIIASLSQMGHRFNWLIDAICACDGLVTERNGILYYRGAYINISPSVYDQDSTENVKYSPADSPQNCLPTSKSITYKETSIARDSNENKEDALLEAMGLSANFLGNQPEAKRSTHDHY